MLIFRKIFTEEFKGMFWSKRPLFLLLAALPVLYSIFFGCAYSSNVVKNVPTAIYDEDQSATSRALVQAYADSERYNVAYQVQSKAELDALMRDNKALVAVTIPYDFAKNIKRGVASEVMMEANSTNNIFANAMISASQEIVQTFSVASSQRLLEAANVQPAAALGMAMPVHLGVRIFANPAASYTDFMLASLMANGLQIAILLVAGALIAREYARLPRWKGISPLLMVAGKGLPCWLAALLAYAVSLAILVTFFEVPCKGSILSVLLLGSGFTFLIIAVSFVASAIANTEAFALQLPLLYIMPGLLFSGVSWPQFAMNGFSQLFSSLMPMTYMADSLRDLLLSGYAPALYTDTAVMYVSGVVLYLSAAGIFAIKRNFLARKAAREAEA